MLSNLSFYHTLKNIRKSPKNNIFKISTSTWSDKFELPDGWYSISDIENYLKYIIKKTWNTIILNFWCLKQRNYLRSIENKITKDNNGENVLHLEITEVILV